MGKWTAQKETIINTPSDGLLHRTAGWKKFITGAYLPGCRANMQLFTRQSAGERAIHPEAVQITFIHPPVISWLKCNCACQLPTRCLGWDLELNWVSFWGFSFLLMSTKQLGNPSILWRCKAFLSSRNDSQGVWKFAPVCLSVRLSVRLFVTPFAIEFVWSTPPIVVSGSFWNLACLLWTVGRRECGFLMELKLFSNW